MTRIMTTYGAAAAVFAVVGAFVLAQSFSAQPLTASADEPVGGSGSTLSSSSSHISSMGPAHFVCTCNCKELRATALLCLTASGAINKGHLCDKTFDVTATGGTACQSYNGKLCRGYEPPNGTQVTGELSNCSGPWAVADQH